MPRFWTLIHRAGAALVVLLAASTPSTCTEKSLPERVFSSFVDASGACTWPARMQGGRSA
jgi:hypothetical protein